MREEQPSDPRTGTVVQGRYEIRRPIAEGAMGAVYEAVRVQIGRRVAVKFLHRAFANDPDSQRRFEREAVAMSKLSHPNCVAVIDFGVDDAPYIVMDLVDGSTVRELIDRGELTPARSLSITAQMLDGLGHAHDNQLVHRDVKPANVKVGTTDGGADHVRVLDFGLAKLTDSSVAQFTEEGIVAGTTTYMSPEHACGRGVDARSDLYSVGLVLFEMLTGRTPFESETAAGMLLMHRDQPAPRLSDACSEGGFSEALEGVVAKALAKNKEDRFQCAAEFCAALHDVPEARGAESPLRRAVGSKSGIRRVSVAPEQQRSRVGGLRPSSPLAWIAVVSVLGLLAVLAMVVPRSDEPIPKPEPKAEVERSNPEQVAQAAAAIATPPRGTVDPAAAARVEQLLMHSEHEGALLKLEQLLAGKPQDAELYYFAGTAYFEVRRWDDGVAAYAEAIRLDPSYNSRPLLNRNVIRALHNQRTHDRARELILHELGAGALPHLRDYQARIRNEAEREQVQALIQELTSNEELAHQVASSAEE